jgi:integrase/recombinase XerD
MQRSIRHNNTKLKYLLKSTAKGGTYWYFARDRKNLIRLPDCAHNAPEFIAAYAAALDASGSIKGLLRARQGSIAALVDIAENSDAIRALSKGYRSALLDHFYQIREAVGAAHLAAVSDTHIRADVNNSTNPTFRRKTWRFLFAVAIDAGMIQADPSANIAPPKRAAKTVSHPPWSADEIAAYRDRHKIGTVARGAMELIFFTAARVGDAVLLGPGMIGRDGVLAFTQQKTGAQAFVPWSCPLPTHAASFGPDRDLMHKALAAMSNNQMTFLATTVGRTRSKEGLGNLLSDTARVAGFKKSAHGLRVSRAIALAECQASTHQIGAWTGHTSLKEIDHYTKNADRRRAVMGSFDVAQDTKSSGL